MSIIFKKIEGKYQNNLVGIDFCYIFALEKIT